MCPGELLFYWSEHTQRMLNKLRSQLIWITACSIDFTRYRSISSNISNCITNQAETPRRSRRSHTDNEHILYKYIMLYWRQLTVCSARTAILSSQPKSAKWYIYTLHPGVFFNDRDINFRSRLQFRCIPHSSRQKFVYIYGAFQPFFGTICHTNLKSRAAFFNFFSFTGM